MAAGQAPHHGNNPVHQHWPPGGHRLGRPLRTFTARLPAGTYDVSFRTPRILEEDSNGISHQTWSSPQIVTVTPRHTARIVLISIVP